MSNSQQRSDESLRDEQRMRLSTIQSDLNRVASLLPSRACLVNAVPWNNAARAELPFRPFEKGQQMNRDASRAARRLSADLQARHRANMIVLYETLLQDALEPMGQPLPRTDVVNLFQNARKEETEAVCAIAVALQAPTPANDQAAAREVEEAAISESSLADALRNRGRMGR